ncbi:MAG: DUF1801 domain-containing protein [bacterium]
MKLEVRRENRKFEVGRVNRNHIGFYPKTTAIEVFKSELTSYHTSKGTIQFPIGKPLPLKLIEKIVRFRLVENIEKKKNQKQKKMSNPVKAEKVVAAFMNMRKLDISTLLKAVG